MVPHYRHEIDAVVRVRVRQTNKVDILSANDIENLRSQMTRRWMRIQDPDTSIRESYDDSFANTGLVNINLKHP
jgi:hypothetical protein